jgi:hypothetical protein
LGVRPSDAKAAAMPQKLDAALAPLAAPFLLAGVLAFRLAVGAALIAFIAAWAAVDACRRLLASWSVRPGAAATPAG